MSQQEGDGIAPPRPEPKLCGICEKEVGKYKCPQCLMPYCSVACNRIHKDNHPAVEPKPNPPPAPPPAAAQANSNDPYKVLLDNEAELHRLFKKYPLLQSELSRIEHTTLPPDTGESAPTNALGIKNPYGKKQHTWSREQGLRTGAAALRKARTDPTDKGDGVREFCDLILYLLSKPKGEGEDARGAEMKDVTELVREEVVAEEAQIIERLLQEEAGRDGGDK